MRMTISARRMELTEALRTHVESRLDKLRVHFDRVIDVDVVLTVEKHRHIAEVTLFANGVHMHSKEESEDMYASIDTAVERLHRQILKFKDRVGARRYAPVKIAAAALEAEEAVEEIGEEESSDDGSISHLASTQRPVHREKLTLKPMSVDEAILQLDLLQDEFLVFMNADTQQMNVVYTREDGSYAVIEPAY